MAWNLGQAWMGQGAPRQDSSLHRLSDHPLALPWGLLGILLNAQLSRSQDHVKVLPWEVPSAGDSKQLVLHVTMLQ